jgi:rifampicin phosphotransferase
MPPAPGRRSVLAVQDGVTFDPPGRGRWQREVAHFPRGQTPLYRAIYAPASADGMRASLARYGVAGSHLQMAYVNDFSYVRLVPLIETPRALASRPAPKAATWLLTRLVPRFRQRTRAARIAFETRVWRDDDRRWRDAQRPAFEAANLALQDEPVDAMDDRELIDHIQRALDNLRNGIRVHFDLAIVNLITVGDFLVAAKAEGIEPEVAVSLLQGSSPASAEVVAMLEPVARAAVTAGRPVTTLDDLRSLGPEAATALDGYLLRFGHRVVAAYDIDQATLHEQPHLIVNAVRMLTRGAKDSPPTESVPAPDVPDRLAGPLAEARAGYGLRDDNSGPTLHWPAGLARRAALEAGARLVDRGGLHAPEHAFELQPAELVAALDGASPDADAMAARAARRRANLTLDPPATLGSDEPIPDLSAAPAPLRRAAAAILIAFSLFDTDPKDDPLVGTGIGDRIVRGRARVAADPADALAVLEPGDVLVVPFTTPAYNAVLPIVSGLIVEEGGAISHAAIVARELDIAAIIGIRGATRHIPDGAEVELDPKHGRVRVVNTNLLPGVNPTELSASESSTSPDSSGRPAR